MPKKKNTLRNTIIVIISIIILFYILYRMPLNNNIPTEMEQKAIEISKMSKTKLELARNVYDFVNDSYTSPFRQYLKELEKIFQKDTAIIWKNRNSYYPSHIQNQIYKKMLLLTGRFSEQDFQYIQSICQISPHEFWILNINGKFVYIDLWNADHNGRFNCHSARPCNDENVVCGG